MDESGVQADCDITTRPCVSRATRRPGHSGLESVHLRLDVTVGLHRPLILRSPDAPGADCWRSDMPRTVELARFTVKRHEEEAFLAERAAMSEAAEQNFEGFVDEMLVRLEDGSYLSIWRWRAREDCDRAMAQVDQVPSVRSWLAHMENEISMEFGVVIEPPITPARESGAEAT